MLSSTIKYNKNYQIISRNDTEIIKGISILLIVFHNYFHWQEGLGIENEFFFIHDNFEKYLNGISVSNFFRYTMAYFGHLGVQLFIFLSGYGLYHEYLSHKNKNFFKYFFEKIKKLAILLFLGMVFAYFINYITKKTLPNPIIFIDYFIFIITGQSNFNIKTMFVVAGPFWFFGLMTQLYTIFPLLLFIVKKTNFHLGALCIFIFLIAAAILQPFLLSKNYLINANFIGNIPVFMLGIFYAKYKFKMYFFISCTLTLAFFYIQNIEWTFNFWAIIFTYIFLYNYLKIKIVLSLDNKISQKISSTLKYIGSISMAIFIINGPLRNLIIFKNKNGYLSSEMFFLYFLFLFLISIPTAKIYGILRRFDNSLFLNKK